ncbi:tetratricopeptide repeat protein [Desulfobacterales bacterium HSG16]|nr:tetratricopeptide repeat protein [Desulfobacterales bacterium HSG16]
MVQKNNDEKTFLNIRCDLLICLFLVIATIAVYGQVREFSFVNLDDNLYLTDRPYVLAGITIDGVIWAFHTIDASNWHPLTWLSHMLDVELYGMNPGQHHITNVLFHIANTLLLFFVLKRMTRNLWQSSFVAALFALHPLHVESVAWIAERKDVLSTFFWLTTMWMYMRYIEYPGIKRYLQVLICFTLGLLSKPMLVTLPFVLILMDYWPLRRLRISICELKIQNFSEQSSMLNLNSLILEKLPFFALTLVSCIVTFFAQKSGGAVVSMEVYSFNMRIANALASYVSYLYKTIWPYQLIVSYPHPGMLPLWKATLACLLLILISLLALRTVKNAPYFVVGWLWYLGTLVPVIGLVQVGRQAMADRYTYVPLIGIFIIIAWGIPDLLERYKILQNGLRKLVIIVSTGAILSFFMLTTWFQIQYWRNSITLFEHAIYVNPDNALAHNNLAFRLAQTGKPDEAVKHYTEALRINPNYLDSFYGMGLVSITHGKLDKAVEYFIRVLSINPEHLLSHLNLGILYFNIGKLDKAVEHYTAALSINPKSFEIHTKIGFILNKIGKNEEAIAHYQYALRINPDYEPAFQNLNDALETIKIKHNDNE